MDVHLVFWCYAYALMLVVLIAGFRGIKLARGGDYAGHMKAMSWAINLLLLFVGSYLVKALVLGREDKSDWEALDLVILYTHESMILLMLIFGTYTRILAAKFKATVFTGTPTQEHLAQRQKHAAAGKKAYLAAIGAFVTATGVMWVLFRHLG